MREGIGYLSFTDRGAALAETIRAALGGEAARCGPTLSLSAWTAQAFRTRCALVYAGAVGIAVRAIAPYIQGKDRDPAVVAVDEAGRFAVPLLSGHLGGANNLARAIADLTGGTAVITTATDLRGLFAVDEWARRQDCAVINPGHIKMVSGNLLAGKTVRLYAAFPIAGEPPEGVELVNLREPPEGVELAEASKNGSERDFHKLDIDVWIDVHHRETGENLLLCIVPRVLILGIGCRRGTEADTLEARFQTLCREAGLWAEAFRAAATIDVKAAEPGLLDFCTRHGWPLYAYSAEDLGRVPGMFTDSAFVAETVGVGNVCERAAVLAAQQTGLDPSDKAAVPAADKAEPAALLVRKCAGEGVTLAAARSSVRLDWNWQMRMEFAARTELASADGGEGG